MSQPVSAAVPLGSFACRSCQQVGCVPVLSLGSMPLANALLTKDQLEEPENAYPLELVYCPHCFLVQITETISPDVLFRDYLYSSSYSDTFLSHARALAGMVTSERRLGPDSLVVEVASNDGYLLQYYRQTGVPVLGIEPARNLAQTAEQVRGVPTLCEFFSLDLARRLAQEGRRADVIHAHNVLAHVPDLNGFVAGLGALLRPGGVAVIEVPSLTELVDRCVFDTIYHEHLCYFSLTALDRLFRRHALQILDVERVAVHGGSLRLFVGASGGVRPSVGVLLQAEKDWGVQDSRRLEEFGHTVRRVAMSLREMLIRLKGEGHRIAAYGASAKGSTLLNYLALPADTLDFVVDRNPSKQGLFTPGSHLPIYPPAKLLEAQPEYTLLLTWNFMEEILRQQSEYRTRGGRFIVPLPEARVV